MQNGVVRGKDEVLERWSKTTFVKSTGSIEAKGWLLDVLTCVERIKKRDFFLENVYAFESALQAKHPANNNVKAKARSVQQLQFLRDKGVIGFLGRGHYRMKFTIW